MSNDNKLNKNIQSLIVSDKQMEIDKQMAEFDIWGTVAHVIMLYKTNIINLEQASKILKALLSIKDEYEAGNFEIDPEKGAQLTLEAKIIAKAGEGAGLAAHTARSRNDQVMVTETLYIKEQVLALIPKAFIVVSSLIDQASNNIETVMPGYTHTQPAKPTTFAQWCLAHASGLMSGIDSLIYEYNKFDKNPLGAAESYGTSWPIDRKLTAKLLGFKEVWQIPQDAISSRGHFQLEILGALNTLGLAINKIATDLMLYTTFEFGMIALGEDVAKRMHPITGSSIMAQKKNPDAVELIRSLSPQLAGIYQAAYGVLTNLPSGYNRDSREIKEYIDLGLLKTNDCLASLNEVVKTMIPNKVKMLKMVKENYSLTTDVADHLAQKTGIPYRLMYKIIGTVVDQAINNGKLLDQVSAEDVKAVASTFDTKLDIDDEDLQVVFDPVYAINQRKHIGGSNKDVTKALINDFKSNNNKRELTVQKMENIIKKAKSNCYLLAEQIANGKV